MQSIIVWQVQEEKVPEDADHRGPTRRNIAYCILKTEPLQHNQSWRDLQKVAEPFNGCQNIAVHCKTWI